MFTIHKGKDIDATRNKQKMKKQNFNLTTLVRPNVAAMKPYSSARDEFKNFDREMIFLDANENPFENGVNRYPDPKQQDLKDVIVGTHGIKRENLLLGNGSDEVLDLLFRSFCKPGVDNIITLPPTYGMYDVLSATNDIQNKEVLLLKDFQPDVPKILETIDAHTKMIFICSPNNPTGNLISTAAILELLDTFCGLVVIDEAYIDFAAAESWVRQLNNYPNLVVTQTLSKAYGLAGIRLGMAFASSELIAVLNKIKPPYNVNALTQQRAYGRLRDPEAVHTEVDAILQSRKQLVQSLETISFVKKVFPTNANFILCRVDDAALRYHQLIKKGIVVRNRSTQALCENTLRFTVGTLQENNQLITALKSIT